MPGMYTGFGVGGLMSELPRPKVTILGKSLELDGYRDYRGDVGLFTVHIDVHSNRGHGPYYSWRVFVGPPSSRNSTPIAFDRAQTLEGAVRSIVTNIRGFASEIVQWAQTTCSSETVYSIDHSEGEDLD